MDKEYEYSFKVKETKDFINYCLNNNYKKTDDYNQIRTLYKNNGKVMARITKNIYKDKTVEVLNFKDDNLNDNVLTVNRETKDLIITNDNRDFVKSLIDILDLNNKKELIRHRIVFIKDSVKFEIDEYEVPEMKVVAIEGKKSKVDKIYNDLQQLIENNIVE